MAKNKPMKVDPIPAFPTAIQQRYADGRFVTIRRAPGDGGVWLARTVPLGPVVDAVSPLESLRPGEPLMLALEELAAMSSREISISRRRTAKSAYRSIQLAFSNVPRPFVPPAGDLAAHLRGAYPHTEIARRSLMLAVRLNPKIDTSGFLAAINSVAETFMEGVLMEEFDADYRVVDDVLTRAGLTIPTDEEFNLADAWWNLGRPDVPYLPHGDHMHIFNTEDAARAAALLQNEGRPCKEWPNLGSDTHTISFTSAFGMRGGPQFVQADSHLAHWAHRMVQRGAIGISIRGKLEPQKVTAAELRRMRQRYLNDIKERYSSNKMSDASQEEMKALLDSVEAFYGGGDGTPTLTEASILVGFTGRDEQRGYDRSGLSDDVGMGLAPMLYMQEKALQETMLGSAVRANPRLWDLPIQTVAYSGLPNLSTVGDKEGVLVGFTEYDRQPAYLSATASFDRSRPPFTIVPGNTGSGKHCSLDTIVQTPNGATELRHIKAGDAVFGRDGKPCTVTRVSPDQFDSTYRVTLSDGQSFIAGGQHQWVIARDPNLHESDLFDLHEDLLYNHIEFCHRVGPIVSLSLDRLVADATSDLVSLAQLKADLDSGVTSHPWTSELVILGSLRMVDCESDADGLYRRDVALAALAKRFSQMSVEYSSSGTGLFEMVMSTEEVLGSGIVDKDRRSRFGIRATEPIEFPKRNFVMPIEDLVARIVNDPQHERIPDEHFLGSVEQRDELLWLLQVRLGERPGAWDYTITVRDGLADDIARLVRSLGCIAYVSQANRWQKTVSWHDKNRGTDVVLIESIEEVKRVPMRCLTVDSPDSTYLIGDYVPTHNTMFLMHLADQFARTRNRRGERTPVAIFDPKVGSSFESVVKYSGGTTVSLDNLISADGMVDPIRCIPNKEVAVQMANNLIMDVNPFGLAREDVEVALMRALSVGANNGAGSCLHALRIAHGMGMCPDLILQKVTELVESNPVFSSFCGAGETGPKLTAAEGITYFRVGDTNVEPSPGAQEPNLVERIKQGFIRAFMYASVEALRGRQGVLLIDEAWVILKHGAGELESIGRLARSMEYLPILFTQRVTDITNAELHGYISRGFILHMKDAKEARAACELFGIDPTPAVINRITSEDRTGVGGAGGFNLTSLRPLFDDETGEVFRGAVAYYCDLNGMAVPTEITIARDFLSDASTRGLDKIRRAEELRQLGGQAPS